MNHRIVKKEAFKVIGLAKRISTASEKNIKDVAQFWYDFNTSEASKDLYSNAGRLGILGISMEFNEKQKEFTYVIGIEKKISKGLEKYVEKVIPAATWAIFEAVGPLPDSVQKLWKYIITEWFPSSGYEHADAPEIEVYLKGNPEDSKYKCQIWIPVIKKQ